MGQPFITFWLERLRETPEEREAKLRRHFEKVQAGAKKLKKTWDTPIMLSRFWQHGVHIEATKEKLADAEAIPLSPYARALQEMDFAAASSKEDKKSSE